MSTNKLLAPPQEAPAESRNAHVIDNPPALLEVACQAANGELQASLSASRHCLALGLASCLATTRHVGVVEVGCGKGLLSLRLNQVCSCNHNTASKGLAAV